MKKGFTLLELLIVIGILAILATAVTLVLNPAELLRQARDGNRLNDLRALNNAIGLFITASSSLPGNIFNCTVGTAPYTGDIGTCATNVSTVTSGAGWVGVNFSSMAGGSPLSRLPLDPLNNSTNYYIYRSNGITGSNDGTLFELNANMESVKYSEAGGNDVESNTKDGGDNNGVYEIGMILTWI